MEELQKIKSIMKIEEINTITNDSDDDILFMSGLFAKLLTTLDDAYSQDWILILVLHSMLPLIGNGSPLMTTDRQVICILVIIMHVT